MKPFIVRIFKEGTTVREVDVTQTKSVLVDLENLQLLEFYRGVEVKVAPEEMPKDYQWHAEFYNDQNAGKKTVKVYRLKLDGVNMYIDEEQANAIGRALVVAIDELGDWKKQS